MRNVLPALASGLAGCVMAVVLVLTGVVTPPARETPRAATQSQETVPPVDTSRQDTELKNLRSELRILRSDLETAAAELRKMRETPVSSQPAAPTTTPDTKPATDPMALANEDLLWMRLFARGIRPQLYAMAVEIMTEAMKKLKRTHKEKATIEGVVAEELWPKKTGRWGKGEFWLPEDFALLITGKARGEIELVADPATPRLKMFFDFESSEVFTWSKEIPGVTDERRGVEAQEVPKRGSDEARASEARAAAGAMKDRARVVYQRTGKAPMTLEELGIGKEELSGTYFEADNYSISGTAEEFVITVRGVYSDEPYDLVLTANIVAGSAKFNR
jgi:hypothetical protein